MICRPELCCSCSEQKCNWKCQGHGHRRLKHHLIDLQCCRKGCKQTRAAYKTPTAIRTYPGGVKRHGGERQRGKLTRVFFQILTRRITDDRASTATTHTHTKIIRDSSCSSLSQLFCTPLIRFFFRVAHFCSGAVGPLVKHTHRVYAKYMPH